MEVADEHDELPLICRLVRVERLEGNVFPILVLDEDVAGLAHLLWIGQLTVSRALFVGSTHDAFLLLNLVGMVGLDALLPAGMTRTQLCTMGS